MLNKLFFFVIMFLWSIGNVSASYLMESSPVNNPFLIDGILNDKAWNNAKHYTPIFESYSSKTTVDLYLAHDFDYFYIGIDTSLGLGWDSLSRIHIDGNHDHEMTTQTASPFYDVILTKGAPGAWSGYDAFWNASESVSPPIGYQSSSYFDGSVSYEYKIPIVAIMDSKNDIIGIDFVIQDAANKYSQFFFPVSDLMKNYHPNWIVADADVGAWANLSFKSVTIPEPNTVVLFGMGLLVFIGVNRKKHNKNTYGILFTK